MNHPQVCNGTDLCSHDPPCGARCHVVTCDAAAMVLRPLNNQGAWVCRDHTTTGAVP